MVAIDTSNPSYWQKVYAPGDGSDLRVLQAGDPALSDKTLNIACSYNPTGNMHLIQRPSPKIGPEEALVHVRATGICGSDVHFWREGQIAGNVLSGECAAGHESAGEVIEIGDQVEGLAIGDKVAIEAGIPCQEVTCISCLRGDYKGCPRMVFHSSNPYHGTMTRFLAHPAAWLHKLPERVSCEEGALTEPLCVATSAVELAGLSIGQTALICGAGPVGLLTLLTADAAGATPIVITDVSESRLVFAKKLIPSVRTVAVKAGESPKDTARRVKEAANEPVDVALDCVGIQSTIATSIYSLAFGRSVMVVGHGPETQSHDIGYLAQNQINLRTLFRYQHHYPKALKLIASGKINVKPLTTHRLPLEEGIEAFHIAGDPSGGAIKVLVVDED
ncbi:hypothetical protein I317_06450 [Kwoniella heveanensis CBS 569]|nr:hypothetical protein I317_06450 [Kwoniella heveanensis CBS 569]